MPVVRLELTYRHALAHGDLVVLESRALPRRGVRWPWETRFCLPDGTCAAEATVELVLLRVADGKRGVVREAPIALAQALRALVQGQDPHN